MGTCPSRQKSTSKSLQSLQVPIEKVKVKNILIRHISSDPSKMSIDSKYTEIPHLLKYNPKYYKSLALPIARENRVFSKIKKIKKLKKFAGFFKDPLPQKLWFNLLTNSRKEIEEIPEIMYKSPRKTRKNPSFWMRLDLQKLKFFYHVRTISMYNDLNGFVFLKENFVKYLWRMRQLKTLKILMKNETPNKTYDEAKLVIQKLNRMERFLCRLETLSISLKTLEKNHQELIQNNKTFFSYVTEMEIDSEFDPSYTNLLQISMKLKSFSFQIWGRDEFTSVDFLKALQSPPRLKQLAISYSKIAINFWRYFKPQASLCNLSLRIDGFDLVNESLLRENIDLVGHWEELKELEALHLTVNSSSKEMLNVRKFIAKIIEKAQNLRVLTLLINGASNPFDNLSEYKTFIIKDIPHLNDSLEVFEYHLNLFSNNMPLIVDLAQMKPFRNLKKLGLYAIFNTSFYCVNVVEAVSLLEENQKEGEMSTLEIKTNLASFQEDWLGDTLKKIGKIKRKDKNLRLILNLTFKTDDFFKLFEKLCQGIHATKIIDGMEICLNLKSSFQGESKAPVEKLRKVLRKYKEIGNLRVVWKEEKSWKLTCIKIGENIQFEVDESPSLKLKNRKFIFGER